MKNIFKFDFSNVKGDFFGGITAGVVALPLALAFGEQTDLGAISGLYGAIAIGILAALLGGTATQISGPTAPMTVVSAVVITEAFALNDHDINRALPFIVATFVLAGLIQVILGVLKFGKYIRFMPYPVISGFMSGIGVIIVITQLFPFLGTGAPSGGPLGTLRSLHQIPEVINMSSILVATVTIAIIYLLPRLTKAIPSTLVALITVSLAVYFLLPVTDLLPDGTVHVPDGAVLKLNSKGAIPTGVPDLQLGFFSVFSDYSSIVKIIEFAITLAALGAIDSLLTSLVADNMTKTKHDSDQELIGQGIGNAFGGLIGGLPGAGATMRTVINAKSGGKTKISGIIAGVFLLLILLGLGGLVGHVPNGVLAGILITVGIGIIDYKGVRHMKKMPRTEVIVMLTVLTLTVLVDLLIAVASGMVLSAILFMKKMSDISEQRLKVSNLTDFRKAEPQWEDEVNKIDEKHYGCVYFKHLDGPLFFGFASKFQDQVNSFGKIKVLVIRMDKVPYIDQSGVYAIEDAILTLRESGIKVVFTDLNEQPLDLMKNIHLIPSLVKEEENFKDINQCLIWLKDYLHIEETTA